MSYENLFTPINLGSHVIKNRTIMPAMGTNYANSDGSVSDKYIAYCTERARGGIGLIVVEVTSVDYPRGKTIANQLKLTDYSCIPGWRELSDAVHLHGTKIICQLHHAGSLGSKGKSGGNELIAPSDFDRGGFTGTETAREMTTEEVEILIKQFIQSAIYAKMAGLDGVELHAAHGYLLSQFLSPLRNKRTDKFGGNYVNRSKPLISIIEGIRKACGKDFILSVRLGVLDTAPDGLTLEEGMRISNLVENAGADLINISHGVFNAGSTYSRTPLEDQEAALIRTKAIKSTVRIPISSFAILDMNDCDKFIGEGVLDMVVKGRQSICDPYWPIKLEEGRENEIRKCLICNEGCFNNLIAFESPIQCSINPYVGKEMKYTERKTFKAGTKKKVIVIGGGIAGMQAAITSAQRGHDVILVEKTNKLGGQLNIACVPPGKELISSANKWFIDELKRQNVEVVLNTDATEEYLKILHPDTVILAVGSEPSIPPIPGLENAIESWSILDGSVPTPTGQKIVVIGGGIVGCETSEYLTVHNNEVIILERFPYVTLSAIIKTELPYALQKLGIKTRTSVTVDKVNEHDVLYTNKEGESLSITCDLVVVSTGQKSNGIKLLHALKKNRIHTIPIGDTVRIGNIRSAVQSGFDAGYNV